MFKPFVLFLDPVLQPADRTRFLCLLLLVSLVTAMLFFGSQPGAEAVIPAPPWDKLAHLFVFGGFAALGWVVLGARSYLGPVLLTGIIGLMDEGMQYYAPGRTADITDIVADLIGATMALLVLKLLRDQAIRQRAVVPVPTDSA